MEKTSGSPMPRLSSVSLLLFLILTPIFVAHGAEDMADIPKAFDLKIDPSMPLEKRKLLVDGLREMAREEYKVDDSDTLFVKFYQGHSQKEVIRYFNERVHYIVWQDNPAFPIQPSPFGEVEGKNIGTYLWWQGLANGNLFPEFPFGQDEISILNTRVGIIQVTNEMLNSPYGIVGIISGLLHEARHSDCSGGINTALLQRLQQDRTVPASCGYTHGICPDGSSGCDVLPWGAFAAQLIYAKAIEKYCTNCNEFPERVGALLLRYNLSDRAPFMQDMESGKAGDPDMSSAGLIRE